GCRSKKIERELAKRLGDPDGGFGSIPEFYQLHIVAREYGKSPDEVAQWPLRRVQEALIILGAESHAGKFKPGDLTDESKERTKAMPSQYLDMPEQFWLQFITDGKIDKEKLNAEGYTDEQLPEIETYMTDNDLYEKAKAKAAADAEAAKAVEAAKASEEKAAAPAPAKPAAAATVKPKPQPAK